MLGEARRSVAGLGNAAALASRATAGMLGRHQADIRHELAGIGEARDDQPFTPGSFLVVLRIDFARRHHQAGKTG